MCYTAEPSGWPLSRVTVDMWRAEDRLQEFIVSSQHVDSWSKPVVSHLSKDEGGGNSIDALSISNLHASTQRKYRDV